MIETPLFARDLMTREVMTVRPDLPVTALVRLLAERGISSVPVLGDSGELIGLVTEADLLRRLAGEEDKPASWLSRIFGDVDAQADRYARTHGALAQDIMTTALVTVDPDATAAHCAKLMEEHRIKRLPVLRDGRLVGIVSRSDLLRAVLLPPDRTTGDAARDAVIREALQRAIHEQPWTNSVYVFTEVKDGVVTLHGFIRSDEVRRAMRVLAERIEGVRRVEDRLEPMPALPAGF
jgi:CBS domain-containing protein